MKRHTNERHPSVVLWKDLHHVTIFWVRVTQPRLLLFALVGVLAKTPGAFAILGHEGEEVKGAGDGG